MWLSGVGMVPFDKNLAIDLVSNSFIQLFDTLLKYPSGPYTEDTYLAAKAFEESVTILWEQVAGGSAPDAELLLELRLFWNEERSEAQEICKRFSEFELILKKTLFMVAMADVA